MRSSDQNCVLVTGSAGFIGSFLTEGFLDAGLSVIGVDNLFRGRLENISDCLNSPNFKFFEIDLSETASVENLNNIITDNEVDTILHFAAVNGTKYFYDRPLFVLDQNVRSTQNILESAKSNCVSNFIYASSSEVYGDAKVIPTDEKQLISLNTFAERDSYSSSKATGEFYSKNFCKQHNLQCLILRIFNIYGPRMVSSDYGQVIPEFIRRILNKEEFTIIGDGEQTRSFCYVNDLVDIILRLYKNNTEGIFNVGNEGEITINELARIIHNLFEIDFRPNYIPARKNDHNRREPDLRKLFNEITGFEYTSLRNGLMSTIEYYENEISKSTLN